MSYSRVTPVDKKKMERRRYAGHHTICQVLREIYQESSDAAVQLKCRTAMAMAKKMHERLKYYKEREESKNDN